MPSETKIYIVTQPGENLPASNGLFVPAHLAYRIGRDMRLYRDKDLAPNSRGLMILSCDTGAAAAAGGMAASEILHECMLHNYNGVMLDITGSPGMPLSRMIQALTPMLSKHKLALYMPSAILPQVPAIRVVTLAPLGGDIEKVTVRETAKLKDKHFAADIAIRRNLLSLPARNQGVRLEPGEAERSAHSHSASPFYSQQLEAMYYTYTEGKSEKLVIWDTAESILRRIQAAARAGAEAVFLVWQEIHSFWPQLEKQLRGAGFGAN